MISTRIIHDILNPSSQHFTMSDCEEIKEFLYILAEIEIESLNTSFLTKNFNSRNNLKAA
jgi:hypothetical protein